MKVRMLMLLVWALRDGVRCVCEPSRNVIDDWPAYTPASIIGYKHSREIILTM